MCLGIPGQIVEIRDTVRQLGLVDVAGVRREVNLACVVGDDHRIADCIGDWVLVHVGFAMSRIDEEEARATLKILEDIGEVQESLAAMRAGDEAMQTNGTGGAS